MRSILFSAVAAVSVVGTLGLTARPAEACGGCFHEPPKPNEPTSVITDHRMVLSISSKETTLYDQIRYSGNPAKFAWVLPINGEAKVRLSADSAFAALDANTQSIIQQPETKCPTPPPTCNSSRGVFGSVSDNSTAAPEAGGSQDAGVTVTKHEVVGPYETVQLASTDGNALNNWLATNGFEVPEDVKPIIASYVNEHFDFLALKLLPGQGVQSMRPVSVTTAGASPILPLRMVAAGAGASVGITLWVIGDGRWEPQNFQSFHIQESELTWDWATDSSDFKVVRAQKEQALAGAGWEVENSIDLSPQQIKNQIQYSAQQDYLSIPASSSSAEVPAFQVYQTDMDTMFGIRATVRVTRLRADLLQSALKTDLALSASADQSALGLVRVPAKENGEPICTVYDACGNAVGSAPRSVAIERTRDATSESFSCSVAPTETKLLDGMGLVALAGFLGLGLIRRRK